MRHRVVWEGMGLVNKFFPAFIKVLGSMPRGTRFNIFHVSAQHNNIFALIVVGVRHADQVVLLNIIGADDGI